MSDWPIIVPAQLVSGRLTLNRVRLEKLLKGRRDCELVLMLERKHATRSLAANAYYWSGVIRTLSEFIGHPPEDVHEFCKAKFLPKKITLADRNGEVVEEVVLGTSTTALNKIQFGEYIEMIRQWAAESLGLNIPDPLPLERVI